MILAIAFIVALLSVPVLNEHYFHIKNLSELRREAGNRFAQVQNFYASGDTKTARDSTRALIEYFSKNTDEISITATQLGMFQLAAGEKQSAVSANDFEAAIYDFNQLLKKFPNTPVAEQAFLMIAKCHVALGDMGSNPSINYTKAIEQLEIIEKNRPEAMNFPKYKNAEFKPGRYFNIDKGKVKIINRDIVKNLYTRVDLIRETATDTLQVKAEMLSDAVILIGDCYTKMGEGEKAREQYRIIVEYFKESDLVDDAQKLIGDSYVKEGDWIGAKAAKETEESLKKGLKAQQAKLYQQAVETYLKFINVYLQSDLLSKVYIALGGVYFKQERAKEAYATFAKAINSIKVIEEQARVQLDIGTYYYQERKWDDAIENYGKVLQNYSGTEFAANAQYLLAECNENKGDTLSALKAYNDVCENFRTSTFYPMSAFKIGKFYIKQKDYAKAQQYLRQSINRFPESMVAPQTQYQLGLIYMEMAEGLDSADAMIKYRLAIKEFETLIGTYDQAQEWMEKSILEMGKAYMKMGAKEKARETLDNLKSQQMMVEKYRILGVAGSDSSIVQDYESQLKKLTDNQARALVFIEIGRKLMGEEINKPDSAITIFNDALKLARDSVTLITIYGDMGNCYMKKGDFKRARALYTDEVLASSRCDEQRTLQFSFKVAESYFRDKMYPEAVKTFTTFLDKNATSPLAPPAAFYLGKAYHLMNNFAEAKKAFQRIFNEYPKSDLVDNAALGFGEALAGEENFPEAITYLQNHLKKNPGISASPSFYFKIADIYREKLAKPDSAVAFYEKVLSFQDNNSLISNAAYLQGKLLAEMGKDDKAIASYEKVRKEDIEYFRAAQGEIGALKAKTDPEGAIQNYEKIENTSTDVADKVIARMGIGDVYSAQKKYPQAVESYSIIYERYVQANPDLRAAAIIKIVDALNNSEKYQDIVVWCDRMIREFPGNRYTVNAYYFKANAFYMMKRYKEAREHFKEVMEKDTGSLAEVALYQRAECLLSMEDQPGAIREFKAFMERYPQSPMVANALFQMANIDWGNENYSTAKKTYIRILGEYPAFAALCWVKNYLAFCYDKEDSWRKAVEIFTEVRDGGACDKEAKQFAKEQIQSIRVRH
jgi:tetratricopeptide (TPR) repeat protein